MSALTIGGHAVTRCEVLFPRVGVWCADLEVDTATDLSGAVSIVVDGVGTWAGAVASGGVVHGLWRGRVVGGAGGLRAVLPALAYRNATLADVVGDALSEAGETLASTSGSLTAAVALFHRAQAPAASAMASAAALAGYTWRVLSGGSVWLGAESWPDALAADITLLERDPRHGRYTLSGDTLSLAPGQLLGLEDEAGAVFVQLADVRHVVEPDIITTTVWQA